MKLKTDKANHKEFSRTKALVVSTAFQHQYAESPAFIESRDPFYVPSMTAGGGEPSPGFFHPETAHRPHPKSDNIFELPGDEDERMIIGGGLGVLFLLGIFALFSWSRNAHLSAPNPADWSQRLPNNDTIGKGACALALGFLGIAGARSALNAGYNTGFGDVEATANRSVLSSLAGTLNQSDSDILSHSLQGKSYPWQWSDVLSPFINGTNYVIEKSPEIQERVLELGNGVAGSLFSGVQNTPDFLSWLSGTGKYNEECSPVYDYYYNRVKDFFNLNTSPP